MPAIRGITVDTAGSPSAAGTREEASWMQTSILQTAALCICGNAYLSGQAIDGIWPQAGVFGHCRWVVFTKSPRFALIPWAPDPVRWFRRLRDEGVVGLRIHRTAQNHPLISDRMAVAFVGGGGHWLIEAVKPGLSDVWEGRWSRLRLPRGDRIWGVTYQLVAERCKHLQPLHAEDERLRDRLTDVLTSISEFAVQNGAEDWVEYFNRGLESLVSSDPFADWESPERKLFGLLPAEGQQLLSAANSAWVFGGMGWWNDMSFEGETQQQYDELSDRLYQLLNEAVVTAVNTSYREQP